MPPIPQPSSTPMPTTPTPQRSATGLMIALFVVVILGLIAQYAMSALNDASRAKESAVLSARMTALEQAVSTLAAKQAVVPPAAVVPPVTTTPAPEQGVWSALDVSHVALLSAFESRFSGIKNISDVSKKFTLKPGETVRFSSQNQGGVYYLYLTMRTTVKPYTAPLDVTSIQVADDGKMSEAKTISVTLNEVTGRLSVQGFQFLVAEYTQTGATTFEVEETLY